MGQNTHPMPGADRDDESGQYTETYPTEEFIDAIADTGDVAGTQDVADYVGCSYETAYKKLRKLEDAGDVESQKVANARVWLLADDG
jgi:predicted ArsR family transcriptional regulator